MGMAAILLNGTWAFEQNFIPHFKRRFHMKFEENYHKGFRGEVPQRCRWTMDGQRTTGDGRQVITIAHPEPLA